MLTLLLFRADEVYSWQNVNCQVHNVMTANHALWIEHVSLSPPPLCCHRQPPFPTTTTTFLSLLASSSSSRAAVAVCDGCDVVLLHCLVQHLSCLEQSRLSSLARAVSLEQSRQSSLARAVLSLFCFCISVQFYYFARYYFSLFQLVTLMLIEKM